MLYICQLIYCSKKIFCEVRYPFYPHHFWGRHEQTTSATVNRVKVFESEEINFQPPFGSRYLYRPTSQNESLLNLLYIFFFLIIISVEHLFMSRMLMWEPWTSGWAQNRSSWCLSPRQEHVTSGENSHRSSKTIFLLLLLFFLRCQTSKEPHSRESQNIYYKKKLHNHCSHPLVIPVSESSYRLANLCPVLHQPAAWLLL